MRHRAIIFGLALLLLLPMTVGAKSLTDYYLGKLAVNTGNGVDAFTLNAISGIYVGTGSTVTAQVTDADDKWAILSDAAGTPSPITATFVTATSGTFDFNATDEVMTLSCNGAGDDTSVDGSGITITAMVAAANALTWTSSGCDIVLEVTNNMGFGLPENMAAENNTAAALTLVFTTAMDAGTAEDLTVDCTNLSLNGCVALLNSLDNAGGLAADFTFTVEGTQNGDLANSANDIANVGPTSLLTLMQFPFTSDDAPASYVENRDFKSIGYVSALCDYTAGDCLLRIYDGDTLIWQSATLADTTKTEFRFLPVISSTSEQQLTVQIYSADAMIVNTLMYVIGRND